MCGIVDCTQFCRPFGLMYSLAVENVGTVVEGEMVPGILMEIRPNRTPQRKPKDTRYEGEGIKEGLNEGWLPLSHSILPFASHEEYLAKRDQNGFALEVLIKGNWQYHTSWQPAEIVSFPAFGHEFWRARPLDKEWGPSRESDYLISELRWRNEITTVSYTHLRAHET